MRSSNVSGNDFSNVFTLRYRMQTKLHLRSSIGPITHSETGLGPCKSHCGKVVGHLSRSNEDVGLGWFKWPSFNAQIKQIIKLNFTASCTID